jgi:molybdopterin converting factor small subunit
MMRVRVELHGFFTVGVSDPDGLIELTLPDGTDVAGVVEALRETSPMLDPRSCLAMVGGARVPLDRTLKDGEEVCLYPVFSGG